MAGELPAAVLIAKLPVLAPVEFGVNVTLRIVLCPMFNVIGNVLPEDSYGPDALTPLRVTGPEPLLETVML